MEGVEFFENTASENNVTGVNSGEEKKKKLRPCRERGKTFRLKRLELRERVPPVYTKDSLAEAKRLEKKKSKANKTNTLVAKDAPGINNAPVGSNVGNETDTNKTINFRSFQATRYQKKEN